ncbi:AIM24 [Candida jiufengensis]|uniref:AIM24 n=1 Tax=Candida jiufengensis TaxID=497108 RepID=UPI0022249DE8|nr:AIM24 [Candida jiufengensis]KAI5953259.1 AIM24 [Candida jiufengensis]
MIRNRSINYIINHSKVLNLRTFQRQQRRYISINQISTQQQDQDQDQEKDQLNQTTTNLENIQNVDTLVPYETIETAHFKTIGIPPTILSIDSPPSVPIFLKRGSLLSIYGLKNYINNKSHIQNIRNTIEYPHFWSSLWYWGKIQTYQKLISTIPFSVLVSFSTKTTQQNTFVNLIIDGKTDWAVLQNNSIQVYTGNSLLITLHSIPKYISKQLSKKLNIRRIETGLKSFLNRGYKLVSGRGQIALIGNGGIYSLNLAEGEEILINKKSILAITVNGPFDLENCIVCDTSLSTNLNTIANLDKLKIEKPKEVVILSNEAVPSNKPVLVQPTAWDQIKISYQKTLIVLSNIVKSIRYYYNYSKTKLNIFLLGNSEFVKIIGPRNILIQSSSIKSTTKSIKNLPTYQQLNTKEFEGNKNPQDYLSYVTINPEKEVVFENTPNFQKTVDEIEKLKNKNKLE